MVIYYTISFLILGTIMGSFFNVVGDRLPNNKSIIYPPSHCENCNHRLGVLELIPIFSFLLQGGKCKNCKIKLSIIYPLYELCCGVAYAACYLKFGLTFELLYALTFISVLLIIIISDCNYYIISDGVLIFGFLFLLIEKIFIFGSYEAFISVIDAVISFCGMFALKLLGDFIFKKESMGGGDIKLMLIFGFVLGYKMALFSIVFGAVIGLPISILVLYIKKNRVVPFGPFLTMAALNIYLLGITYKSFINLLIK